MRDQGKALGAGDDRRQLALGTNGAGGAVMLFHPHELFPLPDDSQPLAVAIET